MRKLISNLMLSVAVVISAARILISSSQPHPEMAGRELDGVVGSPQLDGPSVLIARPEDLSLMAPAPHVPNALSGKVLRRQYLGFKTAYRIQLDNGPEIRVELHAGNTVAAFQAGDTVQVLVPADSRVVSA